MADKLALALVHVGHEDLAGFRAPIEAAGYEVQSVHVPDTPLGPDLLAADLLVAMGGPMGAYQRDAHPWLGREVELLARRIADGGPTLGICLGSQLIAAALGARVYPGEEKEVGFAPLELSPAGRASPLRHLAGVPLLHWHGDTFDLPEGVELLASTDRYRHQAFRRGGSLLALQCHPEMGDSGAIDAWLANSPDYLAAAGTSADRLGRDYARLGPAAVAAGRAMLSDWLAALPA